MLSGWNSIWTRVDLAFGEVGECWWWWALGLGWQWDAQTRRLDGSLAVRSSGGEPYGSQRTISVPVEMEKEPYGDGGEGGDCYQIEELRWASKK